jgi:hypothetical protein
MSAPESRTLLMCDCHGTVVMAERVDEGIVIRKRSKARGSDFKEHHTVKVPILTTALPSANNKLTAK